MKVKVLKITGKYNKPPYNSVSTQQGQSARSMSQEVLNTHQPSVTCLPNPEDYRLLNFIGKKQTIEHNNIVINYDKFYFS